MSENADVPPKGLGSIKWQDILKGVYYAAIGQLVYLAIYFGNSILQATPHFPTWAEYVPYLKAVFASIGGYILGKLGVNNVGQIFTSDKPVVRMDVNAVNELKQKAAVADNNQTNN